MSSLRPALAAVADTTPRLSDPGAQASAEGETVGLTLVASDPDGDSLTFGATGLPAGLSLDASTGEIGGALGYTVSGGSPYSVMVTVSDSAGGSDAATFVWTVADRNGTPSLTPLGTQGAAEGASVALSAVRRSVHVSGRCVDRLERGIRLGRSVEPRPGSTT